MLLIEFLLSRTNRNMQIHVEIHNYPEAYLLNKMSICEDRLLLLLGAISSKLCVGLKLVIDDYSFLTVRKKQDNCIKSENQRERDHGGLE